MDGATLMNLVKPTQQSLWFSTGRPSSNTKPLEIKSEEQGTLSFVAPFGGKGLKITFPSLNPSDKTLTGKYENLETGVTGDVIFCKKDPLKNKTVFSGKPSGTYERLTFHILFPQGS